LAVKGNLSACMSGKLIVLTDLQPEDSVRLIQPLLKL